MKRLLKFILFVIVASLHNNLSTAQTYSIVTNDTISVTGIMEDLATLTIEQLNISNNAITLEWQKVSESVPLNWETNVCDNVICYATLVNGGTMNPINPGSYGFLLMHVTPHVNYGTSTIRYVVWDVALPSIKDTLTYILTVNAPTGFDEENVINTFNLFPNPAREQINISNNAFSSFSYTISDVAGRVIENGQSGSGPHKINTTSYKNGVYYCILRTPNGYLRISKFVVLH